MEGRLDEAYQILKSLWDKGYSSHDIITNIFRVSKNLQMPEFLKLEYIKVCCATIVFIILDRTSSFKFQIGNRFHAP